MTGVVLMYHRVAEPARDPFRLAVSERRFREQVEQLQELACVVPLEEVTGPGSATRIAITFDDGYVDNALLAAPLLQEAGLPATFFITTGTLGGRRFWWDRLASAVLDGAEAVGGLDVDLGGRRLWLDLHDPQARATSLSFLHRRLRPLPPADLRIVVDALVAQLLVDGDLEEGASDATMTPQQLRTMAELSLCTVGAHTRTHLQLAGQQPALQREEVLGSVDDLTRLLGRPVRHFAYPFGTARAVGDLAPRLVHEAGCTLACSTEAGVVPERADRYRLPRLDVKDWSGAQLAAQVRDLVDRG